MSARRRRVSIGMPVYNGEAYLRESLDSLLAQTYGDFELIISDNASTDATESICCSYAARDVRVRYVRHSKNLGSVRNFNRVFELSRSEYFKWAAYDDLCEPTFLERCVEILDRDPTVAWCHTRFSHIDAAATVTDEAGPRDESLLSDGPHRVAYDRCSTSASERFRSVILGVRGCADAYALIRSDVIRKTPLFLPCYGSEKVFVAELAFWGRYHEIPETLFYVRMHAAAAGSQSSARAQQRFILGRLRRPLESDRFKLICGYISAIRRAKLSLAERAGCCTALARYLFQVNKWYDVARRALAGKGLRNDGSPQNRVSGQDATVAT